MACPATAKCSVLKVNDAAAVLNDPRAEQLRILVIVNNPTDARRLVETVPSIPLINISNYGALGDDGGNRTKITETVLASDADFDEFARIEKTGIRCQYQVTPTDKPQSIYELINKIKKGE
jgi:PTS system mannose-specific IIB component